MRKKKRILSLLLVFVFLITALAGCGDVYTSSGSNLTQEEAKKELSSLLSKIDSKSVDSPTLDIYSTETSEADTLADIDTFKTTVKGNGEINLEVAGATEMTSDESPDDWLTIVAERFNKEKYKINGKTVSITVRQITSGEVVTYMESGAYEPDIFIPSAYPWAMMLEASGIQPIQLTDRIAGNTAGILMKQDVYDAFIEKYKEATLSNVITAAIAGDVTFAYPNPYTSTTGLNGIGAILQAFDPENPLSNNAASQLMEYQKTSPPVAYTTAVLRDQAAKGVINAMLMEEQAYINSATLEGYTYIPFGVRHDHPAYTFDYCTSEEQEAAQAFIDYCLEEKNQKLATEKGFNRHDDYESQDPGFSGADWINAQQIWNDNKSGGKPIIAAFVADTSGSMDGEPLNSLKTSLVNTSSYIKEGNYIGLVSYNSDVTVNLPIAKFDATQRAYFSGEVKNMTAGGSTATYDAVLVALDMLEKAAEDVGDAKLMLFLLTDGEQNVGYSYNRVAPVIGGLEVPVYTIAYNYSDDGELEELSSINEAAALNADSDNIVNLLRNLFNAEI